MPAGFNLPADATSVGNDFMGKTWHNCASLDTGALPIVFPDSATDAFGGTCPITPDSPGEGDTVYVAMGAPAGITISAVTPDSASHYGGATITITGSAMGDTGAVVLDGDTIATTKHNPDSVVFTSPAHDTGDVDLVVSADTASDTTTFRVYLALALDSIGPDTLPFTGGAITLYGVFGATQGTLSGASILSWSNDSIEATADSGAGDETITVTDGPGYQVSGTVFYYQVPSITGVSPGYLPSWVTDDTLTVSGSMFMDSGTGSLLTVGDSTPTVFSWADGAIKVKNTGYNAQDTVDIIVTNTDGYSDTITDGVWFRDSSLAYEVTDTTPSGYTVTFNRYPADSVFFQTGIGAGSPELIDTLVGADSTVTLTGACYTIQYNFTATMGTLTIEDSVATDSIVLPEMNIYRNRGDSSFIWVVFYSNPVDSCNKRYTSTLTSLNLNAKHISLAGDTNSYTLSGDLTQLGLTGIRSLSLSADEMDTTGIIQIQPTADEVYPCRIYNMWMR
jgi:hypothetical protein